MARGHNNPHVERVPPAGPCPDWNAVEWWVYRAPSPLAPAGYFYRIMARELSPGEMRMKEELACTVSRCALAAVRKYLRIVRPEQVQYLVDEFARQQAARTEAEDAPFRARMAERRAAAEAEFEARRQRAERRLAEDVARAAPAEAA